jgi:copper chaperone CopZ
MKTVRFTIEELNSNESEKAIEHVIGGFTGVNSVNVSLTDSSIFVNHDPALISEKKIKDALESHGYNIKENDVPT